MVDKAYIQKLAHKARRWEKVSQDENALPTARQAAQAKVSLLENEMISLVFNPFEVQNAEIESKRAAQLLNRNSTDDSNRDKRKAKADAARVALGEAMLNATKIDQLSKDLIDAVMQRPSIKKAETVEEGT